VPDSTYSLSLIIRVAYMRRYTCIDVQPHPAPQTALHLAVAGGEDGAVEELTRRGADPSLRAGPDGDSALHLAVRNRRTVALGTMLKRTVPTGALDVCNNHGNQCSAVQFSAVQCSAVQARRRCTCQ
jgi:hypothetical protein